MEIWWPGLLIAAGAITFIIVGLKLGWDLFWPHM